jgi:hypothetical protein
MKQEGWACGRIVAPLLLRSLVLLSSLSFAARSIVIPGYGRHVRFSHLAGTTNAPAVCNPSVAPNEPTNPVNSLPLSAVMYYELTLTNISGTAQNVTVTLLPGSRVSARKFTGGFKEFPEQKVFMCHKAPAANNYSSDSNFNNARRLISNNWSSHIIQQDPNDPSKYHSANVSGADPSHLNRSYTLTPAGTNNQSRVFAIGFHVAAMGRSRHFPPGWIDAGQLHQYLTTTWERNADTLLRHMHHSEDFRDAELAFFPVVKISIAQDRGGVTAVMVPRLAEGTLSGFRSCWGEPLAGEMAQPATQCLALPTAVTGTPVIVNSGRPF